MGTGRLDVDYSFNYTDNAYNMSDRDLDRFEDGQSFKYVESSDDLIQTLDLRYVYTHRAKNQRFSPSVNISQDMYLNNREKNNFAFGTGFNYRYHNLRRIFRYLYTPQNYTQRYE
jgi:hypothetical protein